MNKWVSRCECLEQNLLFVEFLRAQQNPLHCALSDEVLLCFILSDGILVM